MSAFHTHKLDRLALSTKLGAWEGSLLQPAVEFWQKECGLGDSAILVALLDPWQLPFHGPEQPATVEI